MKIRQGFVSNSSSSSFVLDIRKAGVQEIVDTAKNVSRPRGLDRRTALAVGEDVTYYAKMWIDATQAWYPNEVGLGHWLLMWVEKIGEDHIVFVRASDEGMGGFLPNEKQFSELAEAEMEYH